MPLLNTATKIYKGSSLATKVYRGTVQVWPPAASWGPPQSAYTSQTPAFTATVAAASWGNDFTFAAAGRITGMRYYRAATDGGVTATSLRVWSTAGVQLAAASNTDTGVGWKVATLATPLPITAGTYRLAVDFTGASRNRARSNNFAANIVNGDITMLLQGYTGGTGAYPNTTDTRTYFVDVIFEKAL